MTEWNSEQRKWDGRGMKQGSDMLRCRIEGNVIIGHGTFLHPRCELLASTGATIVVGEHTIIEERVRVRSTHGELTIGSECILEVGASITDSCIGNFSAVETMATIENCKEEEEEQEEEVIVLKRGTVRAGIGTGRAGGDWLREGEKDIDEAE
ncbi:hypothetical protein GUITHDRAFT_146854 [Guillardia theta CCMP2712]|uniref:Dynactin subunit 6 n=1 Tax=Guillardia theta (strain CCMP2712) TaxID=905079 RepID=L1IFB4_GUITC|nr:hypothetical protein GUITHDRAFT_146854 [Guillardia theta CCMP2712]EKX34946.1 hypothetical protein GUITHDRAFT_146854 [Guillardia theta CCMP2712]|eukprot:XP_005821926.1 hypothetical protein GUITHDRAFT_146854 [Guillardia theta CCMP2712]